MDDDFHSGETLEAAKVSAIRDALPTSLGTAEIRAMIAADVRARSVVSARTTSAVHLAAIKFAIDELAAGNTNHADARWYIKEMLKNLGYTPEGGFPEDGPGTVPPAMRGSLQDLSSDRRINLIIETQLALVRGRAQQLRGMREEVLAQFPAWELVRIHPREVPRDWPGRWVIAGGTLYDGRMIAFKADPVWGELGSAGNFDDALDVDFPPFAFQSGMGWRPVDAAECRALGVTGPDGEGIGQWLAEDRPVLLGTQAALPPPVISVKGIPDPLKKALETPGDIVTADDKATPVMPGETPEEARVRVLREIEQRRAEREERRRKREEERKRDQEEWKRRAMATY